MTPNKHWYESRTIWASIVTVGLSAAGLIGLPQHIVGDPVVAEMLVQAAIGLAGAAAIIGRIVARSTIG